MSISPGVVTEGIFKHAPIAIHIDQGIAFWKIIQLPATVGTNAHVDRRDRRAVPSICSYGVSVDRFTGIELVIKFAVSYSSHVVITMRWAAKRTKISVGAGSDTPTVGCRIVDRKLIVASFAVALAEEKQFFRRRVPHHLVGVGNGVIT